MKINYQTLHESSRLNSYADHILHFRELFNNVKVKGFLEWGCGYSTKIFLENSEKVISVELALDDSDVSTGWLNHCIKLFNQPSWTPIFQVCSEEIKKACVYQHKKHKDYALIDDAYVKELDDYIKNIINENDITVSFVDAGVFIRGDLVELSLQNQIPIVIGHDTANMFPDYPVLAERETDTGLYGWFKIKQHENYEKIFIDYGCGTMFWIRKDLPQVVEAMKKYRDSRCYDDYYKL